jgi:hypothetical protein
MASLIELQGSGQLSLFRNESVSKTLRDYFLTRSRSRDSAEGIVSTVVNFSNKYPHIVRVVSPSSGPETAGVFQCDLDAMRADQAFLNDYETMQSAYIGQVRSNLRRRSTFLGQ